MRRIIFIVAIEYSNHLLKLDAFEKLMKPQFFLMHFICNHVLSGREKSHEGLDGHGHISALFALFIHKALIKDIRKY